MFTIPKAGYYEVQSQITTAIPTGKFETVKNPYRKWYEIWKPKMITREIYRFETTDSGREVKYFNEGDTTKSPFAIRL